LAATFNLTAAFQADAALVDIVFLHGLGGSASDTWVYSDRGQQTYWPLLLGEKLPFANVSIVGYPTSKLGKFFGSEDLGLLTATAGVVDLLVSHGLGQRPIFFIGHSLGGIVIKALLRQCYDSSDVRKKSLFEMTLGVIFFGTPNSGASMGNVCRNLPGLTSMQASELARADTILLDLGQWFRGKAGNERIRCHCFYETERLNGQLIVDAASANPGIDGCDPAPITLDHIHMAKLPSAEHSAFRSVSAFIRDVCTQKGITAPGSEQTEEIRAALKLEYLDSLFRSADIRHLQTSMVDEKELFVDPVIYHEKTNSRLTNFEQLVSLISDKPAVIISGSDRSGKSLLTKLLQVRLDERGQSAIRLDGAKLANADVAGFAERALVNQYGRLVEDKTNLAVIIDDFDECPLPDSVKERIIADLVKLFGQIVITSFTHSPAVLFAPTDRPDPTLLDVSPMGDEKLLELVRKWRSLGSSTPPEDKSHLATFELLRKIFNQTEVDKYPGSAISFLQLIDASSGTDINYSSYAACYETLITSHITKIRPNWQNLDEARNFIAYVAFQAYLNSKSTHVSSQTLLSCLEYYRHNFFSSIKDLREVAIGGFLVEEDGGYRFKEEYEWYFLCARHAAYTLKSGDAYDSFVIDCTSNIFRKQYANMVVFMAYFTTDNIILSLLLDILDGLFSKAPSWTLSDEQKTIMLGLTPNSHLAIQSMTDVSPNRAQILRDKVTSIIEESEGIVAQYTLPFLNPDIDDAKYPDAIDHKNVSPDSYMNSLNALMRVHSVIGQILASRSGTFDAKTMMDCITRMVQASGRYIALNHAISAVLLYDKPGSLEEVDRAYDDTKLSKEEKYQKVERLFSFWSVYLSQAGLARYLSHDHAIRALKMLAGRNENAENYKTGHIPFNFTTVLIIASLYKNQSLERSLIEGAINKYGDQSAIIAFLRVAVHFYSYYMPLSIQDKQWLGQKLNMQVRRIEAQRQKAVFAGLSLPKVESQKKARRQKTKTVRKS